MKERKYSGDIAVVGISCRFPKAKDKNEYWENLIAGRDCVDQVPSSRWDAELYYSENISDPEKTYCKWLGSIEDIDKFDNLFFGISPKEALNMDPHQRLLLEESWKCIEDSGISLDALRNKRTSVYIGSVSYDKYKTDTIDATTGSGKYYFLLANRISYFLDLDGECFTMDTGCSSSFVALNAAYNSMLLGNSDYALVGGINLHMSPKKYITWAKSRMLSPTGKCHAFDIEADGYVAGEGVGMVLLQPLEKALEENNRIYGVIKGCAVNHGGHALTLTAPSIKAQHDVIKTALECANVTPDTITYIEAHGTGTSLGDPIEIEALNKAFSSCNQKNYCKIGSVKSNIGHLEGCSSMASLIKVLMMMKYKTIPKALHLNKVNPIINIANGPFSFATENTSWERMSDEIPRRAGISSFGIGGTNAHVIVEEYSDNRTSEISNDKKHLILLSALSQNSLDNLKKCWINAIKENKLSIENIRDISHTLICGRKIFPFRFGADVSNTNELLEALESDNFMTSENAAEYCLDFSDIDSSNTIIIPEELRNTPLFEKTFAEMREMLSGSQVGEAALSAVCRNTPDLVDINVYRFVTELLYYKIFIRLGINIGSVTGNGNGVYAALAGSGAVNCKDMIDYISGEVKEFPEVHRPDKCYYDRGSGLLIRPYSIDLKAFERLLRSVIFDRSLCEKYIAKAKILYEHQYTFKKFMNEWEPYITAWGDVRRMLEVIKLPKKESFKANPSHIILMVMILSSLLRVDKKWGIKEDELFNDDFSVLISLINCGAVGIRDFIKLVMSDMTLDDYNAMTVSVNDILNNTAISFDTSIIRCVDDIPDSISFECGREYPENYVGISICESGITIGNDEVYSFDDINNLILRFWQDGQVIDIQQLVGKNDYKKVELPVYCFEKNSFWQDQIRTSVSDDIIIDEKYMELTPVWSMIQNDSAVVTKVLPENIIIFADSNEEELLNIVGQHYKNSNISLLSIRALREQAECVGEGLEKLKYHDKIFFVVTDRDTSVNYNYEDWKNAFENSAGSLHVLIKLMSDRGISSSEIDIKCLTFGNLCLENEKAIPMDSSIYGLCKSISREFHNWTISVCDLASSWSDGEFSSEKFCESIKEFIELSAQLKYGSENIIRNGKIYAKELRPAEAKPSQPLFKKNGTYAIVGGTGGVGFLTAVHLAEKYSANVVLIGRSQFTKRQEELLEKLRTFNTDPMYISANICSRESLETALENIIEKYGHINGIIHSALDLNDKLLINTNYEEFSSGTDTKIIGSINLCEIFGSAVSDFILFYSSIESYSSFAGQGSYITGCCFQDNYSEYLNRNSSMEVRTINWGYWGETGIAHAQGLEEKFKLLGLLPVSNKEGIEALERFISSGHQSLLSFRGEKKLLNMMNLIQVTDKNVDSSDNVDKVKDISIENIEKVVRESITNVIGIEESDYSFDDDIYDVGIDSINEFEMIVFINEKLGISLQPTDIINCDTLNELIDFISSTCFLKADI